MQDKIHETIKQLFDALQIQGDFRLVGDPKKEGESLEIVLETEDTSLVIGYHGETLEALQLLVSLALFKQLGYFVRVSLEVGDYKKNREEFLKSLVAKTKDRVLMEGREVPLSDLKAWERRVVHMLLQEDSEVETESTGEGKERVLIIKPKNA